MSNADKTKPDIKIILDRERVLRFDLNAMVAYEGATGKSLFEGALSGRSSAKDLRALLWACLLHDDPTLTLEQIGSLITVGKMAEIGAKLNEAFVVAIPEASEDKTRPLAEELTG